ncbi:neutral ceramidase [Sodiomyces alkalinus F11]|uniref:Neutral ceramidase n=1 Tax=Sodiomyces alkalinus (strain CBS 110278 / VKM F-3762 / F11) TaxID=1314773 RepID=A0A3N2PPX3_SODAK|nr:neutral ceramidase [Sodiomyces alkalinus F11]ROT36563.1 neutral ceramidase [Sodiomyces alkalinus F11]
MPVFVVYLTIFLSLLEKVVAAGVSSSRVGYGSSRFRAPRQTSGDRYLLGVGKADITGPVVEIGFAGYADLDQKGSGLRQRLYSRAFIIGDVDNPDDRLVYLVLDTMSGDTAVRRGILEGLGNLGSEYDVYGKDNVAVTGTHSHAAPGAWFSYLLPQVTNLGLDKQSYQAIIDGALLSIKRAHESLTEGHLDLGRTDVTDASINRSAWAYMANPDEERDRYETDVDTAMTLLRFRRASDGKALGILNWFAVHPTSMHQNSTHVAGDNKGAAAYLFEKAMEGDDSAASGFVAGFAQANHADTTPKVLGAWCDDGSGQQCRLENSTCDDGRSQACRGRGPEFRKLDLGVSSAYEIGRRQYAGAKLIYDSLDSSSTPIIGPSVKSFHFFHNMAFWDFHLPDGTRVRTCPASLGYSFAAGTSDGPGAFDFTQADSGDPSANPLWKLVSGLLRTPTREQRECQVPKPILLDVGGMEFPYPWSPNIVDIQTLRVGQLVMLVASPEVTTMAGRRWREATAAAAEGIVDNPIVILGGPANTYSHYVTTPEEYDVQRYEGASTFFGRHTLSTYMNLTIRNLHHLAPDSTTRPGPGPSPPDNRAVSFNFNTGVVLDGAPIGRSFGQVLSQPLRSYQRGEVVEARFQGANPRNNLRLEGTYAAVEKLGNDGIWTRVRDDGDWFLVYEWKRTNFVLGYSQATIRWETGEGGDGPEPGTYRIRYFGDERNFFGRIRAFEGVTKEFLLV